MKLPVFDLKKVVQLSYNTFLLKGGDLVSTGVAKQRRAYRGLVTS